MMSAPVVDARPSSRPPPVSGLSPLFAALMFAVLVPAAQPPAQETPDGDRGGLAALHARARDGDAAGQYHLGGLYLHGLGVEQCFATSAGWYRVAAEQGDAFAQRMLAGMYREGLGVSRSYPRAHMWFSLAALQGHRAAMPYRDQVAEQMTLLELAEAQQRVRDWLARREPQGSGAGAGNR